MEYKNCSREKQTQDAAELVAFLNIVYLERQFTRA